MAKLLQETVLEQKATFLIADVAAFTGVPPPRLRSWEDAGILRPLRSPRATRLYSIDDMARVRLIARSLLKPGRRGSLRRVAKELDSGALVPGPEDYAGLPGADGPAVMSDAAYWQAVVAGMADLVVVGDREGRVTSMNPALRALLHLEPEHLEADVPARSLDGELPPLALETLPLRWAAQTGTRHRDVTLLLPGATGEQLQTSWTVTPLRDEEGQSTGAVGVGRVMPPDASLLPEDWLAVAAHDLRNPVTTILGRLQLARHVGARLRAGDEAATQQVMHHLAVAERSTEHLIRVMQTVLDASRATKGLLIHDLDPEGVDLTAMALQAAEDALQQTSRHRVTVAGPPGPLMVAGDRIRLRQVLDNLLSNAIKYSPDGGTIEVRLEMAAAPPVQTADGAVTKDAAPDEAGGWAWVRVADTGIGIAPAALPHVFDRYWRAPDAETGTRGAGLGLYVCRAIVSAHGGHIWVERSVPAVDAEDSASSWHGTVVAIVLPLGGEAQKPGMLGTSKRAGQKTAVTSGMAVTSAMAVK